jgi:very-short-patch-repair endonuclease
VSLKQIARKLRHNQTDEEKELWRALRGRQFAGFKFRRQHMIGGHILDFYCADAKLDVELDGFQHGLPEGIQRDEARENFWRSRVLKPFDSGIINGKQIATGVCWKSGTHCKGEPAAFGS